LLLLVCASLTSPKQKQTKDDVTVYV